MSIKFHNSIRGGDFDSLLLSYQKNIEKIKEAAIMSIKHKTVFKTRSKGTQYAYPIMPADLKMTPEQFEKENRSMVEEAIKKKRRSIISF